MSEHAWMLTPDAAAKMAEAPGAVRENLRAAFGDDVGDAQFLMLRFIEGRERRELPEPTEEEMEQVKMWYAKAMADQYLLSLVMKGAAFIDPLDTKDGDEMGFSISEKGREALGQ